MDILLFCMLWQSPKLHFVLLEEVVMRVIAALCRVFKFWTIELNRQGDIKLEMILQSFHWQLSGLNSPTSKLTLSSRNLFPIVTRNSFPGGGIAIEIWQVSNWPRPLSLVILRELPMIKLLHSMQEMIRRSPLWETGRIQLDMISSSLKEFESLSYDDNVFMFNLIGQAARIWDCCPRIDFKGSTEIQFVSLSSYQNKPIYNGSTVSILTHLSVSKKYGRQTPGSFMVSAAPQNHSSYQLPPPPSRAYLRFLVITNSLHFVINASLLLTWVHTIFYQYFINNFSITTPHPLLSSLQNKNERQWQTWPGRKEDAGDLLDGPTQKI